MQGRVGTYGHVSTTEVVVDRAYHADDVQMTALLPLIFRDATWESPAKKLPIDINVHWRRELV